MTEALLLSTFESIMLEWLADNRSLDELAERVSQLRKPPRTIWHYSSDQDGYLAGVVLASSAEEAQARAFEELKENRTEDWADYHADPSGIYVEDLNEHGGWGDGEGNVEFQ